ncbi:lipopolysaccharide kinase InaA family protein [Oceanimonas sp. CHS3-5]|uniref:lipopolysaccharide kinase InaA family protein n=1 Tax=Oceanimonas sp. CHS3-5 TaxID=3068186 RepID=UPI00273EE631|nr:lipopolysaccharide kinase InaA family protein [Oceanimonas sp. CHS3-5]MDP5292832.1 lipopolysaccharide kinase InaA family protein [Oceanimonas sp. CHS3-5]
MKRIDIPVGAELWSYWLFAESLNGPLRLVSSTLTDEFEAVGSSRFYLSEDGAILGKVSTDRYSRRRQPLKWLLHDYLEKRLLLQTDAAKEYRSLRILQKAGLRTPRCFGWGVSLHPDNAGGSLLLMEHRQHARSGGDCFEEMDETKRLAFLTRFSEEVARLARAGYVHRDLHYNNLLLDAQGEIIWIDAHVRRLPRKRDRQWDAIRRSLTVNKLRGEPYRVFVEQLLRAQLPA